MNKKFVITLGVVSLLGVGAWGVKTIVTDKMYSKLSEYVAAPEVQKEIEAAVSSELAANVLQDSSLRVPADDQNKPQQQTQPQQENKAGSAAVNGDEASKVHTGVSTSKDVEGTSTAENKETTEAENAPVIKNRSEAVQFATKKFSAQEITHYSSLFKNRNSLTPEQKQQIKSEVLSKFTPEELKVLLAAANR